MTEGALDLIIGWGQNAVKVTASELFPDGSARAMSLIANGVVKVPVVPGNCRGEKGKCS